VQSILTKNISKPTIKWRLNGEPFLTSPGILVNTCTTVIQQITGKMPELSTSGGTSDARFIAPYGIDVLELGPLSASIHQVNEHVSLRQLELLSDMYLEIMQRLLCS
jgi:succinyl-diaminopimelate desuccinylase